MHSSQPQLEVATPNVFHREGEYWTIAYEGLVVRLRDTKGLRYLAQLLRRPGQRFPAAELAAAGDGAMRNAECGVNERGKSAIRNPKSAMDERARIGVTKHLKAAIRKIQGLHPALGYHLGTSIKTGYRCGYLPDPTRPAWWTVGGCEEAL